MAYTLVVHILNADPVVGEVDDLPSTDDMMIKISHPRRIDGKDIHYISDNAMTVYWPLERINFIEVLGEEHEEEIIGFVRE
jgi:hypothetical protein